MRVQNLLQERIMNGTYRKGAYLPGENALCEELEVSRTTVRDAVSALVEKGFLKREHGKGVLIVDACGEVLSDSFRNMMLRGSYSVAEFLETREMIEQQMSAFAAKRATEEEIGKMEKCIECMIETSDNLTEYVKNDFDFHMEIALASKNRLLIVLYSAILPMLKQMILEVVNATGAVENEMKFHRQILDSIKKGDSQAAQDRAVEHDKASERMFRSGISEDVCLNEIIFKNQKWK